MPETIAQHAPAIKVGGRRLSVSKHKPHIVAETKPTSPTVNDEEPTDYPRPSAPGDHANDAPHHEEEIPKRERRHSNGGQENERRLLESVQRKLEQNRPSKDPANASGKSAIGGGGRIAQPAGKGFMV